MAVAIQTSVGLFVQPSAANDLMAVASPTNSTAIISSEDNTATGSIWEASRVYLGKQSTIGATYPLRGPGGNAPPGANVFPIGKVMQSGGWAEMRKGAATNATFQGGSNATTLVLANTETAIDDFLVGAPVTSAVIGSGFQATTLIQDWNGAGKQAVLAETLGAPAVEGANYTIPAYLSYILGTLTTPPPVLSISVWRDKKRYDYKDWAPASIAVNIPVANEANTQNPDITFSGRGTVVAVVDDITPTLPTSILALPVPPARNGKFYLDRVKLGHQSLSFTQSATLAAASNQNQAAGQDGFDIISGSRATALDLNQMAVTDFDLHGREDTQKVMSTMSTWGMGPGNNFGFIEPNIVLDPFSPGDRGGYVNLTGNAVNVDQDKSAVLTIWW
jgi:hypothetical protein